MNYIYTILFFLCSTAFSIFLKREVSQYSEPLFVVSCLFAIITSLFVLIAFFRNLYLRELQVENFNNVRYRIKELREKKNLVEKYKQEMEEFLTKTYPDYEKDIFGKISPGDREALSVYIAKYPELKFNGILTSFTRKLTVLIEDESNYKREVLKNIESVSSLNVNPWILFKVKIPQDIHVMLNADTI